MTLKQGLKPSLKINSRAKGCRGEREACELLRSHGIEARRGQQFKGSPDSPDVVSGLAAVHLEIKRTETLSLYPAIKQAERDAGPGEKPVVLHRRNGEKWLVIMLADDAIPLLKAASELVKLYPDL